MDKGVVRHATLEAPDVTEECESEMASLRARHNRVKVLAVMSVAVVLGAFGDISLSKGMKMLAAAEHETALDAFLYALTNPFILAGVGLLICFLMLYLASLSWEDLSFVLPLTAVDYVLVTLFAYLLLGEPVSDIRWIGSVFVAIGVALVARS